MFKEKRLRNNKVEIYYELGDGRPILLFLHGSGCNMTVFNEYRRHFSKLGFGCLSIDLRGCGKSSLLFTKESYVIDEYIKDLKLVLDEEGIDQVSIVAHSIGTTIAQAFTAKYPKMVDSMVLISGSYNFIKSFERSCLRKFFLRNIWWRYFKILDFFTLINNKFNKRRENYYPDFSQKRWIKTKDLEFDLRLRPVLGIKQI